MRVLNSLEAMSTSTFTTPGKCRAVTHEPYLSKRDQISRACRDNDGEFAPPLLLTYATAVVLSISKRISVRLLICRLQTFCILGHAVLLFRLRRSRPLLQGPKGDTVHGQDTTGTSIILIYSVFIEILLTLDLIKVKFFLEIELNYFWQSVYIVFCKNVVMIKRS